MVFGGSHAYNLYQQCIGFTHLAIQNSTQEKRIYIMVWIHVTFQSQSMTLNTLYKCMLEISSQIVKVQAKSCVQAKNSQ